MISVKSTLRALALSAVCLLGAFSQAAAEDLVAVVHESNSVSSVSKDELKQYYLGQITNWGSGGVVSLVVQPPNASASKALFKQILKMAPSRFKHLWQEKSLSGQGVAPKKVGGSADAVISQVSGKPTALGVLLKSEAPAGASGVKLIPVQ